MLGQQVEQDRQLRLVIEVAGDELERVGVERREQLLVAEAQQLLEAGRFGQNSWFFSRCDDRYRLVPGSSGFTGRAGMPGTLAVMPGVGQSGVVR